MLSLSFHLHRVNHLPPLTLPASVCYALRHADSGLRHVTICAAYHALNGTTPAPSLHDLTQRETAHFLQCYAIARDCLASP